MIPDRAGQIWEIPPEWGGETVIVLTTRGVDDNVLHDVFILKPGQWTRLGDVTVFRELLFQDFKSIRIL